MYINAMKRNESKKKIIRKRTEKCSLGIRKRLITEKKRTPRKKPT